MQTGYPSKGSVAAPSPSARQWSFVPSVAVLLPVLVGLCCLSTHLHYTLPTPQLALHDSDGHAVFSEKQAMTFIENLSMHKDGTPRYRIVGTTEMVETEQYLLDEIEKIKQTTNLDGLHEIEAWHQGRIGSGDHLFEFMGKQVHKKYYGIGNVIVRLSDGTPATKANAILVNAHSDSTLPSPGAADDLVGVATMLEALRVMSSTPRKLTNSVIFLFNGAEESLQDASHLFITQHPLRKTVRAVINLEACGVGGPEIVFQATSEEMIRALAYMPRPYGTVLATEVFGSGIIISDTDFRQFEDYGNITGLDMALVQGSYLYHTRLDTADRIEPGALQHMGENTLALLEYLTSNATAMGNSPTAVPLPKSRTSDIIYFSGLGGQLFLVYTRAQATLAYTSMAAVTAIIASERVDWSRKGVYLAATLGIGGSLVAALVGANAAAFVQAIVMDKTLTWFRHEALPIVVYAPPATLGAILFQRTLSNFIRSPFASSQLEAQESSLLEHATMIGTLIFWSAMTLIGHAAGLGSSYLFAICAAASLAAVLLNDFVLKRGAPRSVHLAAYIIGQISPLLLGVEGLVGFLDLFVPLTGRMGADAPADFIIASLTAGVGFLTVPMLLPFSHRHGAAITSRIALGLTFLTAATMGWFTRPTWNVYDADHPKRLLVLHMENTTFSPPSFELHVATVDGADPYHIVEAATRNLSAGSALPERVTVDDYSADWDIIFPVSQFLTSYKVPLPSITSTYESPWSTFTVVAERSVLNAVKRTRSLDIVMDHPLLMWPVLAFDADVVSWDLSVSPERGVIRHHVKSVAAFGVSRFSISLVIRLSEAQFDAAVRQDQRRKGQRGPEGSEEDRELGGLLVDYSGLDSHGMFPASSRHTTPSLFKPGMDFFAELDKNLPPYVDAMLLSAVAGSVYI